LPVFCSAFRFDQSLNRGRLDPTDLQFTFPGFQTVHHAAEEDKVTVMPGPRAMLASSLCPHLMITRSRASDEEVGNTDLPIIRIDIAAPTLKLENGELRIFHTAKYGMLL
jgi:hypothetical protein